MAYSTGEIAELCGVTVRTVQYYDKEGLLKPESYSEGGRRLYGEASLKTLQMICLYRGLGLSLSDIRKVLSDEQNSKKILLAVLDRREKTLDGEIGQKLAQRDSVKALRESLTGGSALPRERFADVRAVIKSREKMKGVYAAIVGVSILTDGAQIAFIVLWAALGLWLPFAVGMPVVLTVLAVTVALYYKKTQYKCVDCGVKFKPRFREWFFARHTSSARRLTCPFCKTKNYHTEIYRG